MTAHAEWKSYNYTDTYEAYIDYSRIRTEGQYKSTWDLIDYKSPQTDASGKQFKSAALKNIIDCQASRRQLVAIYQYSEQMGKGKVVSSGNSSQIIESDWKYPPPNSIGDNLIQIACGRK